MMPPFIGSTYFSIASTVSLEFSECKLNIFKSSTVFEALCYLSVTNIKKAFCNTWFFGKNKPCVKCGTNKHHKVNLVAAIANVCISDGTFLLLLLSRQEAFFYIPSIPFIVPFLYMYVSMKNYFLSTLLCGKWARNSM